ncbi:MAG: DUF58 domain-containing protein [Clostridiaceae bacterium]|nr:DUF58 domain-containing protein [Clostridiaceae bacterium]
MLPKDLIKKIKYIEIKSKKLAGGTFASDYRSRFRGKGMEFDSIRQYYPGDDVRNIDWNVTARQNKAYVKQFCEERDLNIFLLIDMSRSTSFGRKREVIAEISAMLAFSASISNDRVGAIFYTENVEKFIPSASGRKHVLAMIESILEFRPKHAGTKLAEVLKFFSHIEKKRSVVFVISDFLDGGTTDDLNVISKRHDLVLIRVIDRAEAYIPAGAIFTFEDLESGRQFELDNLKKEFRMEGKLELNGCRMIDIYTDEDYVKPLRLFFRRRAGIY